MIPVSRVALLPKCRDGFLVVAGLKQHHLLTVLDHQRGIDAGGVNQRVQCLLGQAQTHRRGAGHFGELPGATICPVRLPGRESRLAEAPFERMGPLVAALAWAIEPYLAGPFGFFGHSMGAVVAFELARLLRRRQQHLLRVLIASAARAPQYRRNHVPPPAPNDERLLDELRRLQGVPHEALDEPAVVRVILPALRADTALYRNYVYTEDPPLPCPIRAYGGDQDPHVLREHLEAWSLQTSACFAVRLFEGGHFYLNERRAELLQALAADIWRP